MVALVPPQRLNLPFASTAGIAAGAVVALGFMILPSGLLDSLVDATHIASALPAAEPPLGFTARSVLALGFGTLVGGGIWLALGLADAKNMLPFGKKTKRLERLTSARNAPVLRRADAHPDAPAREPLIASRDLGTPFLDVQAPSPAHAPQEKDTAPQALPMSAAPVILMGEPAAIPADLDTPLAAYAPTGWCPAPAPDPKPVASLRAPALAEGERIEAFELKPAAGPTRAPGDHPASIQALLDRLEHGIAQRPIAMERHAVAPLQNTIAELRRAGIADR